MIEIVVLPTNEHEAPEKRWNNFTARTTANVFAIVSNYRIQGELQLPNNPKDSLYTLTHQLGRFFPITRTSITGPGTKQFSVPVLLANKDLVNCFNVGESANVQSASVERQPQLKESDLEEKSLVKLVEDLNGLIEEADSATDLKVNSSGS